MERQELKERVAARVTRCDWKDFIELASAYGFGLEAGKGSRRRLVHAAGLIVSVHQPHPTKRPVHPEAVKALLPCIEQLEQA
ncbi:MAG: type II toxin-antitoxin system HicA family toxin [Thermaceae bacterium]|nr:type II toxin-antitoxin system HicA family toxin [Thermaceae bacterium]